MIKWNHYNNILLYCYIWWIWSIYCYICEYGHPPTHPHILLSCTHPSFCDDVRGCIAYVMRWKEVEFSIFISSDGCWPRVAETIESETVDEGGLLYLNCLYILSSRLKRLTVLLTLLIFLTTLVFIDDINK